jgi:hypothetical protein
MSKCVWVRVRKYCAESGDTDKAVRRKIESGVWPEGIIWRKAPDGSIRINLRNYNRWVEGRVYAPQARTASRSISAGKADVTGNVYAFDPRVPTSNTQRDSRRP